MSHRNIRRMFASTAVVLIWVTAVASGQGLRFEGRPVFKEGHDLGYFLWRDGDTWKVRWTTFGAKRHFTGGVEILGGRITSFKRVDVDEERRVIRPGRPGRVVVGPRGRAHVRRGRAPVVAERKEDIINQENDHHIRFNALTDDDIDGFDFKVGPSADAIRFNLQIDGRSPADQVDVGRDNEHPREDPFVIRLR